MKLVVPLLALLVTSISASLLIPEIDNLLSNYACNITRHILENSKDLKDVIIANFGGHMWSSAVNNIAECAAKEGSPVTLLEGMDSKITDLRTRKVALVVMTIQKEETVYKLNTLNGKFAFATMWHEQTKSLALTTGRIGQRGFDKLRHTFFPMRLFNLAILLENSNKVFAIAIESVSGIINITDDRSVDILDRDKLKNLGGYYYKIPICIQVFQVTLRRQNELVSRMHEFMLAITKIQNAHIRYFTMNDCREISRYWIRQWMDLTYNTGVVYEYFGQPKLQTYKERGFCALVPLPPKTSFLQLILVRPFDLLTWLLIVLSIFSAAVVFWAFRGRGAIDSPWLVAYGVSIMIIGQGVDFSRRNRLVLTTLLQLMILMIFVLSSAYDGVVTSFMIQQLHEKRLHSFSDIVESNFKIMTDEFFAHVMNVSTDSASIMQRVNASGSKLDQHSFEFEIQHKNYVFILQCELADSILDSTMLNDRKVSDYYYKTSDMIMPHLMELEASFNNPFIQRLQYYMDLSFEAGLPYYWDLITPEINPEGQNQKRDDEVVYLKLEDLTQVFSIWAVGLGLSLLVFLLEIFCHDCFRYWSASCFEKIRDQVTKIATKKNTKCPSSHKGALYYTMKRHKMEKRPKKIKLHVRQISVQPRADADSAV